MRNYHKKRGWKNILQSKPVLAVLSVVTLVFAFEVVGFMGKMEVTIENRKIVENKVAELEKQKEQLSSDIFKLKTQSGIEDSIREKFGLAKEGENIIIIMDDKNPPNTEETPPEGFFSHLFFWKNWFK